MRIFLLKIFYTIAPFFSFIDPFYGLLFYFFISVIRPESLTWGGNVIGGVFYLATICLLLSCIIKRQITSSLFVNKYILFFCLYVGMLYLSTYISPYTIAGEDDVGLNYMKGILQILIVCVCMFGILHNQEEDKIHLIIHWMLLFFFIMALWGLDQHRRGNELVEGLFGHAVIDRCAICGVFTLYIPLALWMGGQNISWKKIFGWICFIFYTLMVVFTQSRAGFLGTSTAIFIMIRYMKIHISAMVWGLLALVVIIPFLPSSYLDRIRDIRMQDISGTQEITDYSSASRLALWGLGLYVFSDHPILGVGNLNFQKTSIQYAHIFDQNMDPQLYHYIFSNGDRSLQVHNMFINILAEGGLLSSIPFYLICFIPLIYGHKMIKRASPVRNSPQLGDLVFLQQALISGLVGFFVTAFFANDRLMDYFYWNLTLCYLVGLKIDSLLKSLNMHKVG